MIKIAHLLNENNNAELRTDALNFIKNYLGIKSKVVLKHATHQLDTAFLTQQMAGVGRAQGGTYEIQINFNDTQFGFVRRLAHELVHVKQMESGKLKFVGNDTVSFNGKKISKDEYKAMYHSDNLPEFEEEAFAKERTISNLY
jgi:hypothetical protein